MEAVEGAGSLPLPHQTFSYLLRGGLCGAVHARPHDEVLSDWPISHSYCGGAVWRIKSAASPAAPQSKEQVAGSAPPAQAPPAQHSSVTSSFCRGGQEARQETARGIIPCPV